MIDAQLVGARGRPDGPLEPVGSPGVDTEVTSGM
jgi:hypothetical protein